MKINVIVYYDMIPLLLSYYIFDTMDYVEIIIFCDFRT